MATDLIVVDEYYREIGGYFKKKGEHFEKIGKDYVQCLKSIKAEGICSGETADALEAYIALASKISECASSLGDSMNIMMENYIQTIDAKDRYIY